MGHLETVRLLLETAANARAANTAGQTSKQLADTQVITSYFYRDRNRKTLSTSCDGGVLASFCPGAHCLRKFAESIRRSPFNNAHNHTLSEAGRGTTNTAKPGFYAAPFPKTISPKSRCKGSLFVRSLYSFEHFYYF